MRVLHTSDWHLGRAFHGVGMLDHQAAFVDHLLEVIDSESIDFVVVSGDIYDRGLPPVDAVALADATMGRLAASRARAVITSGNHDSARRLGFAADLIDHAGVHLRTDASTVGTPVLLDDAHGTVAVYGIPYLDPETLRRAWDLPARSHQAAMAAAMGRIRADLDTRPGARSVVLAHAFVGGGTSSDSERDISVGGVSMVAADLFDGIDYTALGHLHGQQQLRDRVRYSGSPLAYSFSESGHTKGSWLIDLGAPGSDLAAEFVPAPVPRQLGPISGDLDTLLTDPGLADMEDRWLQVTLTDATRPAEPMERLRTRFPHALSLQFAPAGGAATEASRRAVEGRSDHQVSLDFVAEVRHRDADDAEAALLLEACDACCADTDVDAVVSA